MVVVVAENGRDDSEFEIERKKDESNSIEEALVVVVAVVVVAADRPTVVMCPCVFIIYLTARLALRFRRRHRNCLPVGGTKPPWSVAGAHLAQQARKNTRRPPLEWHRWPLCCALEIS